MTLKEATECAVKCAQESGTPMVVAREGPHADDWAELDEDGESYGYCPRSAARTLYPHGQIITTVESSQK